MNLKLIYEDRKVIGVETYVPEANPKGRWCQGTAAICSRFCPCSEEIRKLKA